MYHVCKRFHRPRLNVRRMTYINISSKYSMLSFTAHLLVAESCSQRESMQLFAKNVLRRKTLSPPVAPEYRGDASQIRNPLASGNGRFNETTTNFDVYNILYMFQKHHEPRNRI